jgi:citrate synthase
MSWLTAVAALRLLGVRPQTLYANVSRKKIRSKPDPKDTRCSLYHEADVRRMARQRGGQRKATAIAAAAIEWGDPILASAVSTVVDGRLYYRGRDAVVLSEDKTFEEVAHILWGAEGAALKQPREIPNAFHDARKQPNLSASPLQRAFLALGLRAGTDFSSYGRTPAVLQAEAESVLVTLADAILEGAPTLVGPAQRRHGGRVGGGGRGGDDGGGRGGRDVDGRRELGRVEAARGLHDRAAASWRRPEAADIMRRALVLLADHELNASTFATRVTVSTGAPLSAGVLSGLATLSGPLHGRASLGVLELVGGVVDRVGAAETVRDWLSQGRSIAGFGHPLYPQGDPRATALLQQFPLPTAYEQLRDVVEETIGERPNVDFALAALTKVFDLPRDAPLILFALGRCAGWLAHALEQVTTGHPIRPRARYVGPSISGSVSAGSISAATSSAGSSASE